MSAAAPFGGDVLIADTSVWRRADRLPDGLKDDWQRAVANNQIASSPVVLIELLYRSRHSSPHFQRWRQTFAALSRYFVPDRRIWQIVVEAYTELATASELEGMSLTDAVLAATATHHQYPVLHLDQDYERLAALDCMDFEPRRILPAGIET